MDSKLQKIYRVETADSHDGPFNGPGSSEWDSNGFGASTLHAWALPKPRSLAKAAPFNGDTDRLLDWLNARERRFGFKSLDQLRRWFPSHDAARLRPFGYVVGVYTVPDGELVATRNQVAFTWQAATRVQEIPL